MGNKIQSCGYDNIQRMCCNTFSADNTLEIGKYIRIYFKFEGHQGAYYLALFYI